jgi:glutathione S-transferase
MILYDLSWGLFPGRVTIYLAEKGTIPLEKRETWDPQSSSLDLGAVKAISPSEKVPVLVTRDGAAITQSRAILEYLEECFPEPNLIGVTPLERARTRELLDVLNEAAIHFATWCQHISPIFVGRLQQRADAGAQGRTDYFRSLELLERMAANGPFLSGERLTIADCVLGATFRFTEGLYGVQVPASATRLREIYGRLQRRPSMSVPPFPAVLQKAAVGLDGPSMETISHDRD